MILEAANGVKPKCVYVHYETLRVPKPVQVHFLFHNARSRYMFYFIMHVPGTFVISFRLFANI